MSKFMRSRRVPLVAKKLKVLDEELNIFLDGLEEAGQTLRTLREQRGWSIVDLAERAGLDPEHISDMEKGVQPIPEGAARRFSEVFTL